jgi:hypothetical protein
MLITGVLKLYIQPNDKMLQPIDVVFNCVTGKISAL